ncbi:MAG TPA: roadblock/LC7 domain-containing protein [Bacteroidetes bacterium]|nr:roadblock/LC7 domain-containing protein [Bacteroidota bacterium]
MRKEWMDKIASIYGVDYAYIVDRDGLVIAQAGEASDRIAPHSALMVTQLIDKIGVRALDDWGWTQCETEEVIIAFSYVYIGILVLVMHPDANLTKVRIEAENLRQTLKKEFVGPFVT